MTWKGKEKQLSPEEAIDLARRELAPFWMGSDPLLAAVRGKDGNASVLPLDKKFDLKSWFILLADLTTFSGESVLLFAREWSKRYQPHELGFILVAKASYPFLSSAKALQPFLRKSPLAFPGVLDHDGALFAAFGASAGMPKVLLLQQRKVVFERAGAKWLEGTERELQGFLRLKDPGLPLSPVFAPDQKLPVDIGHMELGQAARPAEIHLAGNWAQEPDRAVALDPSATLQLRSPAARLSLIAGLLRQTEEYSRVRVELNGDAVFDSAAGEDLTSGDDGGSAIKVAETQLYHALAHLPEGARQVTLRFPDADRLPVAIYSIRLGI